MARDRFEERWRKQQESHLRPTERPKKSRPSRSSRDGSALERAADRFGLAAKANHRIGGHIDGLAVAIHCVPPEETTWRVSITAPDLPYTLALQAETALSTMKKSIAGEDVLTFDEAFDRAVSISSNGAGKEATALAVLDAAARKKILALLKRGLTIEKRILKFSWTTKSGAPPSALQAAELRKAIALAKRMSLGEHSTAERLLRNARRDPHACVRLNNLAQLLRGPHAIPRVEMLTVAALALDALDPEVESLSRAEVVAQAFEVLAAAGAEVEDLERFTERGLLALFGEARGDAKRPIVEALGRIGTRAAVEALLPHASGLFVRAALKQAVRAAIAEIEGRAGADRGRLSVVPFTELAGALGIAGEEGGLAVLDES